MKKNFLLALLCLISTASLLAQSKPDGVSLLWKVSGKDMPAPSYLFGTYHLLSNSFVDTLPAVKAAYQAADIVVGELVIDSSVQAAMMASSRLNGSTLKQTLPDSVYAKAAGWFSRQAGVDLAKFDELNPVTIMILAIAITQQKYFPNKPGDIQLDTYFQEMAKKDGKKIMGLETVQAQINAMYGQLSLQRQSALLYDAVKEEDGLKTMIGRMNKAYTTQNLRDLQELTYGSAYEQKELEVLLNDRNNKWMVQLPGLMKEQSLFVAVGALHLIGKTGLVEQLRKKGYTVSPLNLLHF